MENHEKIVQIDDFSILGLWVRICHDFRDFFFIHFFELFKKSSKKRAQKFWIFRPKNLYLLTREDFVYFEGWKYGVVQTRVRKKYGDLLTFVFWADPKLSRFLTLFFRIFGRFLAFFFPDFREIFENFRKFFRIFRKFSGNFAQNRFFRFFRHFRDFRRPERGDENKP